MVLGENSSEALLQLLALSLPAMALYLLALIEVYKLPDVEIKEWQENKFLKPRKRLLGKGRREEPVVLERTVAPAQWDFFASLVAFALVSFSIVISLATLVQAEGSTARSLTEWVAISTAGIAFFVFTVAIVYTSFNAMTHLAHFEGGEDSSE